MMRATTRTLLACTLPLLSLAPLAGARAAGTSFSSRPIAVNHTTDVEAAAISDTGRIVATSYSASGTATGGFVIGADSVQALPPPIAGGGQPQPRAIDADGNVLGYAYQGGFHVPELFLYRPGSGFDPRYQQILVGTFGAQPFLQPNPIGLARQQVIFYTEVISLSAPTDPAYGVPAHLLHVPQFNLYQTIRSINRQGMVAGVAYSQGGPSQVFVGRGADFTTLSPPGAVSVSGGYIDDDGQVAGNFTDTSGAVHGFVYKAGLYMVFDMPEPASSITVTGISANGRVVGSYTPQKGRVVHAFLFNGQVVTAFGDLPYGSTAEVSVNRHAQLALAVLNGRRWSSYAVSCSGPGC